MVLRFMKTTLEIPDALFRDAKKRAAEDGVPLRAVVERALRELLSGAARRPRGAPAFRWHVVKGQAPPAVPIEDRERLFDLMGGR